jgi:hypothetical protein
MGTNPALCGQAVGTIWPGSMKLVQLELLIEQHVVLLEI